MKYRSTLTVAERHFVGRLESFGDIVVGFSMSQLALQLEIPKTPHDIFAHPMQYVVFFGAFAVVTAFWIRFHRIMSVGFAPRPADITLLFAFLAFVALTPYALVTYSRMLGPAVYSREIFMLYFSVFLGVATSSALLSLRGMRRAWPVLDETERRAAWHPVMVGAFLVPVFVLALTLIWVFGPIAGGTVALLAPLIRIAQRWSKRPWPVFLNGVADAPVGTLATAGES